MQCKCGFKSSYLDEVTYYDINGNPIYDEIEVERNCHNPDALAHVLCNECAETVFSLE